MSRLLLLFLTSVTSVVTASEKADRLSVLWAAQVERQLQAALAEQAHRRVILTAKEQLSRAGHVSADELYEARELAANSTDWVNLLSKYQHSIKAEMPCGSVEQTGEILLTVPGTLSAGPSVMILVHPSSDAHRLERIADELFVALLKCDPVNVQQRAMQRHIDRLRQLLPILPEAAEQIEDLELQIRLLPFQPKRLDQFATKPVFRIRHDTSADDDDIDTVSAVRWLVDSRELLMKQTARTITFQKQRRMRLTELVQPGAVSAGEVHATDLLIGRLQAFGRRMQQERLLAALPNADSPVRSLESTSTLTPVGQFMRWSKRRWDELKQQHATAAEDARMLTARVEALKRLAANDVSFRTDCQAAIRDASVAQAKEHQLRANRHRAKTLAYFAMQKFAVDTGRSADLTELAAAQSAVFEAATDLAAECELCRVQQDVAQLRLSELQQLMERGDVEWVQVNQAMSDVELLELTQRRLQLRQELADICLQLVQRAGEEPMLAMVDGV